MQTFSVEINQANLQESLDHLDEKVKEASFTKSHPHDDHSNKKFYRRVTCVHDTVVTLSQAKVFLIRAVEFEESYSDN